MDKDFEKIVQGIYNDDPNFKNKVTKKSNSFSFKVWWNNLVRTCETRWEERRNGLR